MKFSEDGVFDWFVRIFIGLMIVVVILMFVGFSTGVLKPVQTGIHRVYYSGHTYIKNTEYANDGYTSQIIHDPDCSCGKR